MVSKDDIKKLIEATDMAALVSPYVKLIKSGSGYKGLCPFHHEDTPSFSVSQEKHLAKCFGCGKGGSPIQFLMDIKHLSYIDAVRELAKINNMDINLAPPSKQEQINQKYYEINKLALDFYERNLWHTVSGEQALKYLNDRGLTNEIIKKFKIGLAPKEPDLLYRFLHESKYLELDMVDCGLVRNNNDRYYDVFTDRIIFPITNESGKVLGFSGRIYQGEKNLPKYLNTAETPAFKKNSILYNLENAIEGITQNNRIVLHEGFMDVIATVRAGINEAVCSMGTALTQNQIKIIKKYTTNVVLCYDSDKAGILATYKAIDLFESQGFNIKILRINGAKDSDEFVSKFGLEKYLTYFNSNQIEALEYIYQSATANLDINNNTEIEGAKKIIFDALKNKGSAVLAEKYLNRLSGFLNISTNALLQDYEFYNKKNPMYPSNQAAGYDNRPPAEPVAKNTSDLLKNKLFELRIFKYATISKEKALEIDSYLEKNQALPAFKEVNRDIWILLINEYYNTHDKFDEEEFVKLLRTRGLFDTYYNNALALEKFVIPYTNEDLKECLKSLVLESRKTQMLDLQNSINKEETPDDLKRELIIRKFKIKENYERLKK